jgi:hypothetical protein
MERLPDELLVLIARFAMDPIPSLAVYGLGSVSRRARAIVKLASTGSWLRVSGCASLVACLASFRDAPSVSVEAQVTARTLAVALTRKSPTRLANLCVGAVISRSARDAARLMRALAKLELRSLDITMTITNGIGMLSSLRKLTLFASDTRTLACVSRLTRLCDLELASCHALVDVSRITSLVSLTRLAVSYCSRLIEVAPIGAVASLTDVSIAAVSARMANIATLTSLGSAARWSRRTRSRASRRSSRSPCNARSSGARTSARSRPSGASRRSSTTATGSTGAASCREASTGSFTCRSSG